MSKQKHQRNKNIECSDIQGKSCISVYFAKYTLLGSLRMEYQFFSSVYTTKQVREQRNLLTRYLQSARCQLIIPKIQSHSTYLYLDELERNNADRSMLAYHMNEQNLVHPMILHLEFYSNLYRIGLERVLNQRPGMQSTNGVEREGI